MGQQGEQDLHRIAAKYTPPHPPIAVLSELTFKGEARPKDSCFVQRAAPLPA